MTNSSLDIAKFRQNFGPKLSLSNEQILERLREKGFVPGAIFCSFFSRELDDDVYTNFLPNIVTFFNTATFLGTEPGHSTIDVDRCAHLFLTEIQFFPPSKFKAICQSSSFAVSFLCNNLLCTSDVYQCSKEGLNSFFDSFCVLDIQKDIELLDFVEQEMEIDSTPYNYCSQDSQEK